MSSGPVARDSVTHTGASVVFVLRSGRIRGNTGGTQGDPVQVSHSILLLRTLTPQQLSFTKNYGTHTVQETPHDLSVFIYSVCVGDGNTYYGPG